MSEPTQTPTDSGPTWKPGDVANNHVLEEDGVTWRLLPPPPGSTPPSPKSKSRKGWWIAAGVVALLILLAAVLPDSDSSTPSRSFLPSTSVEVLYEVEGTTTMASITISTPGGGTSQQSDIDVPLTRKADHGRGLQATFRPGEFLYLSAQNSNDSGSVTCRITVDGVVVSENTSHGAYVIASCDGRA